MSSINKAIVVGRVGRDAEMRYTPDGSAMTIFSIATNRTWTTQTGEKQEATEWHNIVAWRQVAEVAGRWVKRGRLVYVEGRLETRSWDDKDSGKKMYRTEIVVDTLRFLDSQGEISGADGRSETDRPTAPRNVAAKPQSGERGSRPTDEDRVLDLDDTPF
jgi:single-strand DNA-binding protein